ncbi:MAG: UDP-N-acetylmuramate dehydrogenase [Bacteroidaceae bacterium]|nr:UDP-N-acetylmuramate dehydrogenase [Bacteroidaceae bacterium]
MQISRNTSLLSRNTFGIDVQAEEIVDYSSVAELQELVRSRTSKGTSKPLLHIGGGSNLLFLSDFKGMVLHSQICSMEVTSNNSETVSVRVGAGCVWDEWVEYAISCHWYGLENLSLIPGEVGAAAVQNIGAYGAEAKDFITLVETVDLSSGELRTFGVDELDYSYRSSRFKTDLKGRYAVTYVHFCLSRTFRPHLDYGGLRSAIEKSGTTEDKLTAAQLRQIIIDIRQAKLPDPKVLGNGGSFFINPVVERPLYERIAANYDKVPHYDIDAKHVKIPAGWLIEQCGWKGRSMNRAAVYEKQALVLVNTGGASGSDIMQLCRAIQTDVQSRFGISISPEVNIIG